MNTKQKRHTKFHNFGVVVYLVFSLLTFYSLQKKDEQGIFLGVVVMGAMFLLSELSSRETVQKIAEELEHEQEPQRIRVRVYGFKADNKNKKNTAYTASFLVSRNGDISPSEDLQIMETPEPSTIKILGSPPWHQIAGQPDNIVMLGRVFFLHP